LRALKRPFYAVHPHYFDKFATAFLGFGFDPQGNRIWNRSSLDFADEAWMEIEIDITGRAECGRN